MEGHLLAANGSSSAMDPQCLELNVSTIVALNLSETCSGVFGSGLPIGLMAVIQVFYALVCVVGLCGNTLVIYVVLR